MEGLKAQLAALAAQVEKVDQGVSKVPRQRKGSRRRARSKAEQGKDAQEATEASPAVESEQVSTPRVEGDQEELIMDDALLRRAQAIIQAANLLSGSGPNDSNQGEEESTGPQSSASPKGSKGAGEDNPDDDEADEGPSRRFSSLSVEPTSRSATIKASEEEEEEEISKLEDAQTPEEAPSESDTPSSEPLVWVSLVARAMATAGSCNLYFTRECEEGNCPLPGQRLSVGGQECIVSEVTPLKVTLDQAVRAPVEPRYLSSDGTTRVCVGVAVAAVTARQRARARRFGQGRVVLPEVGRKGRKAGVDRLKQAAERKLMSQEESAQRKFVADQERHKRLQDKATELRRKTRQRLLEAQRKEKQERELQRQRQEAELQAKAKRQEEDQEKIRRATAMSKKRVRRRRSSLSASSTVTESSTPARREPLPQNPGNQEDGDSKATPTTQQKKRQDPRVLRQQAKSRLAHFEQIAQRLEEEKEAAYMSAKRKRKPRTLRFHPGTPPLLNENHASGGTIEFAIK